MKRSLLFIFLFLAFKSNLHANKGNNSTVSLESASYLKPQILEFTDKNDVKFALWEQKSPVKNKLSEIFLQKINKDGGAEWPQNVPLLLSLNHTQNAHKLISDQQGGVIIAWEERMLESEETNIYAQHVDSLGNKLWGANGIIISAADGSQITPYLTSDSNNKGIFIVWNDSRNDLTGNNWDVYAQHITFSGEILWQEDGIPVSTDIKDEFIGKVLPDSKGGITIIWNKVLRDNLKEAEGYEFYSRKLDPKGETNPDLLTENFLTLPAGNTNYDIAGDILSDGNDGFFLALTANRITDLNNNLFIQHVLADGAPVFAGNLGLMLDSTINNLQHVKLHTDSAGNILVMLTKTEKDSLLTYTQKIDSTGNIVMLDSELNEPELIEDSLIDTSNVLSSVQQKIRLPDSLESRPPYIPIAVEKLAKNSSKEDYPAKEIHKTTPYENLKIVIPAAEFLIETSDLNDSKLHLTAVIRTPEAGKILSKAISIGSGSHAVPLQVSSAAYQNYLYNIGEHSQSIKQISIPVEWGGNTSPTSRTNSLSPPLHL